jgi:hypothetical protein
MRIQSLVKAAMHICSMLNYSLRNRTPNLLICSTTPLPFWPIAGIGTRTVSSSWAERMHAHIAAEITKLAIFVLTFHQVPITAGWPEAM